MMIERHNVKRMVLIFILVFRPFHQYIFIYYLFLPCLARCKQATTMFINIIFGYEISMLDLFLNIFDSSIYHMIIAFGSGSGTHTRIVSRYSCIGCGIRVEWNVWTSIEAVILISIILYPQIFLHLLPMIHFISNSTSSHSLRLCSSFSYNRRFCEAPTKRAAKFTFGPFKTKSHHSSVFQFPRRNFLLFVAPVQCSCTSTHFELEISIVMWEWPHHPREMIMIQHTNTLPTTRVYWIWITTKHSSSHYRFPIVETVAYWQRTRIQTNCDSSCIVCILFNHCDCVYWNEAPVFRPNFYSVLLKLQNDSVRNWNVSVEKAIVASE